jgi:hypothetical protein
MFASGIGTYIFNAFQKHKLTRYTHSC